MFKRLEKAGWQYSIGVRMIPAVRKAVEQVEESAWQRIEYPEEGEAQIAETAYGDRRLIVRPLGWSARKRSCGPTGVTSRSSPTAPRTSRSSSPSIAITPSLNR